MTTLLPTITNIVNLSLSTGDFPEQFKLSSVIPALLKKYNLNKEDLSNYRPISHLSFISKVTEQVVEQRLTLTISHQMVYSTISISVFTQYLSSNVFTHHLSSNGLLNYFIQHTPNTTRPNPHFSLFTITSSQP